VNFTVVIPARFQSTRLPGKPLLEIAGRPMLHHVIVRGQESQADAVYVATDDERIVASCREQGYPVLMTATEHQSGTDRIEEVARQLGLADDAIIVNVQGDEPLIPPAVINQVAADLMAHPDAGICTLYERISGRDNVLNPNQVKVVTDHAGYALYFSRAPIPYPRDNPDGELTGYKRHVGIYAYRVGFLHDFVTWPRSPLESTEQLEQLRALNNGVRIHVQEACEPMPAGVDTPEDLEHVRALLARDGAHG
jgi:3-deoxy-manno-octulosonate cytidylyltransferase (CMP-KDO synthetase)